eukprot:CAMPEP_0175956498 /NCGR_PEP_ID=MMETSP0108-20121206/33115_1 /TAXON_ID=195067 ORGANISM="Goniomonas pacifica, Strain CCMP1869" /NCGR_SAMPLE_ID=MMETSP0108 /ASSEMBLY_ACC=CAM_ASM_000204 /LENGTH=47 /DNA_ID= /DNA_START= /DNA_END= /DNA_ORIENTATION=
MLVKPATERNLSSEAELAENLQAVTMCASDGQLNLGSNAAPEDGEGT